MDIRSYFQKLRAVESSIGTETVVVVSEATPDGGKSGVKSEVKREVAAQLITEGRARLATDIESREFRTDMDNARTAAEQQRMAGKVQLTVLSEQDLKSIRSGLRQQKG